MRKFLLLFSSVLFATAAVRAHEHAPRVLSPHNADAYSMKSFARFHRWRDLTGDAKVYEILRYLAAKQTGLYPLGTPAREGDEVLSKYHAVRDPVKTINVHPIGNCLTLGSTTAGVMRGMGIGQTRAIVMPGYKHVAAEVFYAGQWHFLDLDLRAVFRQADALPSHVMEIRPKRYDRQDFNKYLHEPPSDFDPTRNRRRAIGPFVASIAPPPNTRIAWFSAGGSFRAHGGYPLCWSTRREQHPNLCHQVRDVPCKSSPVVITHGWREMGQLKKKTVHLQKPGAYEIVIASEPEDEYVEISVPGGIR